MKEPLDWNDVLKKGDRVIIDFTHTERPPRHAGRPQVMAKYERDGQMHDLTLVSDETASAYRQPDGRILAAYTHTQHRVIMNALRRNVRWRHLPGRALLWGPAMPFFALATLVRGMGGFMLASAGASLGEWLRDWVTFPTCTPQLHRMVDADGNALDFAPALEARDGYAPRPMRFEYVMT